jgi:hypothetical protein
LNFCCESVTLRDERPKMVDDCASNPGSDRFMTQGTNEKSLMGDNPSPEQAVSPE